MAFGGMQGVPPDIMRLPVAALTQLELGTPALTQFELGTPAVKQFELGAPVVTQLELGVPLQVFTPAYAATPRSPIVLPEVRFSPLRLGEVPQAPQAFLPPMSFTFREQHSGVFVEEPPLLANEEGIEPPEDFKPKVALPEDARGWSRFEKDLYLQSDGIYHPGRMAQRRRVPPTRNWSSSQPSVLQEVAGRVSVVSPTMSSRQHFHEQLWGCFEAQAWPDKELIVIETYVDSPSLFLQQKAQEDERLVHVSFKIDPDQDFTVGLKRDMTLHLASGEFVANFDDDDVYAASYLTKMVSQMQEEGLKALTLSCWYNYFTRNGTCGYSDRDCWAAADLEELEEVLYGYGFSYVHRRREALAMPYPNVDFAEDAPFMLRLRKAFGDHKVGLKKDEEGICMHIIHRANSTGDPEFACQLAASELAELEVSRLPLFKRYLDAQRPGCWPAPFSVWPWSSTTLASLSKSGHGSCL